MSMPGKIPYQELLNGNNSSNNKNRKQDNNSVLKGRKQEMPDGFWMRRTKKHKM